MTVWNVTLANIRAHRARLVAVSIAVILAVAFMSATLLLASSSKATFRASIGAEVANADVIVQNYDEDYENYVLLTPEIITELSELDGVVLAAGQRSIDVVVGVDEQEQHHAIAREIIDAPLDPATVEEGRAPETPTEVALDRTSLGLLKVDLGDNITVSLTGEGDTNALTMRIVGVTTPSKDPFAGGSVNVLVTSEALDEIVTEFGPMGTEYDRVLVSLEPGASVADFREALTEVQFHTVDFEDSEGAEVLSSVLPLAQTPDEMVEQQVNSLTNDTNMLLAVLLAFVGIALFVAGLVIANTFSVLVAQRARELALLRCVGASTAQVYRAVLTEALVMALVASVIGVALAFGIIAGLVWLSGETGLAGGVGVFSFGWEAIVLPILAGIIVTLIAANGPARGATHVSPLAALRTRPAEVLTKGAGRVRFWAGLSALMCGVAVIAGGLVFDDPVFSLGIVLMGSMVTAVGVLMLAVFVIPAAAHTLARVLFVRGVPGRLAALNSVRNPQRTAATASALLVGVTLVATVYTGAEVAKSTLAHELAASFPVDMAAVVYHEGGEASQMNERLGAIASVRGVEEVVGASAGPVTTTQESVIGEVWGIDPLELSRVTRDAEVTLRAGETLLGSPSSTGEVTLVGEAGTLTLRSKKEGVPRHAAIVTPRDFEQIAGVPGSGSQTTWVALLKLNDGLSAGEMLEIRDELADIVPLSSVSGEGIERAMYEDIIETLLLIVTALLAVAIIIAVIGIGNTLSLSVIERTRENALLRALGLTRGQLRAMLAAEALVTGLTAALIGVVLGAGYGGIGARAVLSPFGTVIYRVPWTALGAILGAALVASLIASVMPARRAVKLSPVAALQTL